MAVALYVISSRLTVQFLLGCGALILAVFAMHVYLVPPGNRSYCWPSSSCSTRMTFFCEEAVFCDVSQARALGAAPCCIAAQRAVVVLSRQVVFCETRPFLVSPRTRFGEASSICTAMRLR